MRRAVRPWISLLGTAALAGVICPLGDAVAAERLAGSPSGDAVAGAWQHHKATFSYVGFTTLYTCDGLEDQVRQILLHLGARPDARVSASGCRGPSSTPTRDAWVNADFYTLAPAPDPSAPGTVVARWAALRLTPQRPSFIRAGDCDLVQEMKDLITRNFSLRDVGYRADCLPHDVTLDTFEIKGQALKAMPEARMAPRQPG